ncbi:MAG: PAS domain S-box protein [Gemmatimonadaceae bacterium]|nr:PAS domain S-box protein [Gemmatimonadaceae bacterium]NUR18958.1 PAS domain S-box protein [Gemmatimonadaceae bacterium]NUS96200.1 PAS domain S-box protein [Gemmatimonadaceae bacterium]
MSDRRPTPRSSPRLRADPASQTPFDQGAAERERAPGGIAHEVGELHRLLVESVQDYAIFALDPDGYILSWNAGAERFKGYAAEEIVGKHFSIFYPKAKVESGWPEHELKEAARVGRFEDEGWRIRKDGSRFWANVVITALRDSSGQLLGFAKVTRDLTERRAAEEALRLSEERFRLLVTSVKDYAIFMLDPGGHVATWNEGAERAKGYKAEEIIGKHFSIFYPPEKVAVRFPDFELAEAARVGHFEDEGWRIRKDGSRFWANVVITALRDGDGKLVGFGKVTRDLTERRAAETRAIANARHAAAEEAARHAADVARARTEQLQLLTSALASVHTIPEIVRIVFKEAFPLMGVDAGSLGVIDDAGTNVRLLAETGFDTPPERFRTMPLAADLPMTTTITSAGPVVCRSRSERDRRFPTTAEVLASFEVSVVLPLMSRGRPMGALAMHRRAGERPDEPLTDETLAFMQSFAQQCGQALERARLYESERQARRVAEDARARAEEARTRAEEANRAKSEFLAAMSHELRTPLNAIGGYAQLMELGIGGVVSDEQRDQLSRIRRSQQHLLGIINDILNFSRIDAGQLTYNPGSVPLREVVDSVRHMVEPQAIAKGLVLEAPECPSELHAWADRAKLEQIVLNLLSNAVKFTAPGGRVSIACDAAEDGQVRLTVRDTGSGIPEDQLERIFEPFVQVGRSLTVSQEGTGLGLAISRDLARAMNGDIRVQSTVDVGSTFTLTLPRDEESAKGD